MKKIKAIWKDLWASIKPRHQVYIKVYLVISTAIMVVVFTALGIIWNSGKEEKSELKTPPKTVVRPTDMPAQSSGELLELAEPELNAHKKLIDLYSQLGHFNEALDHIERLSDFYPNDLKFQTKAGKAYLHAGKPIDAMTYLSRASELNPEDKDIQGDLAYALFYSGETDSALQMMRSLAVKDASNPVLQTRMATLQTELENNHPRTERFAKITEKFPEHGEAWYQWGRFLARKGDYASSAAKLEKAQLLDPTNHKIYARLGNAALYRSQYRQAERYYRTALSLNPKDYNSWYNLGEFYYGQANHMIKADSISLQLKMALDSYLKTLKLNPQHAQAHYRVGLMMNANRQYKEAANYLKTALELSPGNARILTQMGVAMESLGYLKEARENYKRAQHLDPTNQVIAFKLRRLEEKIIEERKARNS